MTPGKAKTIWPTARWLTSLLLLSVGCTSLPILEGESAYELELRGEGRIRVLRLERDLAAERGEEPLYYLNRRRPVTGLDQLAASGFALLKGRRFALLVNDTSRLANHDHLVPALMEQGLRPQLVLEPEHGLYGFLEEEGPEGLRTEPRYGLSILNLHSRKHRRPDAQHLAGIDLIVVDLENLPVRCYTYISTLTYVLEAADELGIEVLLLDRPNLYGAWPMAGSLPEPDHLNFVAAADVPFLYNLTLGEYAIHLARTRLFNLQLRVIPVQAYEPDQIQRAAGRVWFNPSPNIPDFESALVYPGVVFFEGTNVSLGRGTTRPFVHSGAPWFRARRVVTEMRQLGLPGVEFSVVSFSPSASLYRGRQCRGVQISPISRSFDPLRTGYEYMRVVNRLHQKFHFIEQGGLYFTDRLWGGAGLREAVLADRPFAQFAETWREPVRRFAESVRPDRLY